MKWWQSTGYHGRKEQFCLPHSSSFTLLTYLGTIKSRGPQLSGHSPFGTGPQRWQASMRNSTCERWALVQAVDTCVSAQSSTCTNGAVHEHAPATLTEPCHLPSPRQPSQKGIRGIFATAKNLVTITGYVNKILNPVLAFPVTYTKGLQALQKRSFQAPPPIFWITLRQHNNYSPLTFHSIHPVHTWNVLIFVSGVYLLTLLHIKNPKELPSTGYITSNILQPRLSKILQLYNSGLYSLLLHFTYIKKSN